MVLAKSEDVWHQIFRQNGREYREPTLVLFTDQVQSACGIAGTAIGPFYCPGDEKVYIDLAFYDESAAALQRARRFRTSVCRRA